MQHLTRPLCLAAIGFAMMIGTISEANAQYPVYGVQPVAPAVVGYAAQRRGLFGRRVVLRPVVAPVAVAPVAVARPVVPVAVARPVVPAPVASYYPPAVPVTSYYPPVAPVTSYYAPAAPVAVPAPLAVPVPVTTYRVPISTYVPVVAF